MKPKVTTCILIPKGNGYWESYEGVQPEAAADFAGLIELLNQGQPQRVWDLVQRFAAIPSEVLLDILDTLHSWRSIQVEI